MSLEIDANKVFIADIKDANKLPNPGVGRAFVKLDKRPVNPPRLCRDDKRPPRPGRVDRISVIPDN